MNGCHIRTVEHLGLPLRDRLPANGVRQRNGNTGARQSGIERTIRDIDAYECRGFLKNRQVSPVVPHDLFEYSPKWKETSAVGRNSNAEQHLFPTAFAVALAPVPARTLGCQAFLPVFSVR